MSTRSNIGILEKDGKVTYIYCHWDGYVEYVGAVLNEFYNTDEKIRELIALGAISSLGKYINPPEGKIHTFDNPLDDVTVAYCRDRKETGNNDAEIDDSEEKYLLKNPRSNGAEFTYLWKDGEWFFSRIGGNKIFALANTIKSINKKKEG